MNKKLLQFLTIMVAVGFTSFTNKPFISKTFYYVDGSFYQRIEDGVNAGTTKVRSVSVDPNSLNPHFKRTDNWMDDPYYSSATLYHTGDGSSFIYSFTVSLWEADSDGDNDGGISLQEALNAIYYTFRDCGTYPISVFVDSDLNGYGVTVSDITRAEDAH